MANFLKKIREIWDPIDNIVKEQEEMEEDEISSNQKIDSSRDYACESMPKIVNFQNKNMHISCFKPEDYGSRTVLIADELMSGSIVIIDLSGTGDDVSRRIIDFLRGIVHAKNGKFMKVANCTYVLAPKNTDITGSELISELENNNIYI